MTDKNKKIHVLGSKKPESLQAVEMLEHALEDARAGKIRACAVTIIDQDNTTLGNFVIDAPVNADTLIGSLYRLISRVDHWSDGQ